MFSTRQVELLAAVVDQAQAVVRRRADAEGLQAVVAADAVFLVDDQVALGNLGRLGDELVGALAAAGRAADALAQQVLLADEAGLAADEAALQAEGDDGGDGGGLALRLYPGVALLDLEAVLAQQVRQAFAGAAGPGGDHGAAALTGPGGGLLAELLEGIGAGPGAGLGEDVAGASGGIHAACPVRTAIRAEHHVRPGRQHRVPTGAIQVEAGGRHGAVGDLAVPRGHAAGLGVVGDHLQPGLQHLLRLVVQADRGVG